MAKKTASAAADIASDLPRHEDSLHLGSAEGGKTVVDVRGTPTNVEGYHDTLHDMLEKFAPSVTDNLIASAKADERMWALLKGQRELFEKHSAEDKDKYAVGFLSGLQLAASLVGFGARYVNSSIVEGTTTLPDDLKAQAFTYGFHQTLNLSLIHI